jgi:RNA polymerase sigma-70 factor (sigma-E family)
MRAQHEEQFEHYVAARSQALLRLAFVLTRDRHLAEDLVQSALTDAFRHWRKVRRAEHPDAYVRRMLVNTHLSWARRRSSTEHPAEHLPEPPGTPDQAESIATRDALRRALETLPPRARTVLVLRFYADLDDAAIASLMGVGISSVRATASRALATLRADGAGHAGGARDAAADAAPSTERSR